MLDKNWHGMSMKESRVREILEKIKNVRIAVYGDFCLDAYWILDPHGSEVSVETGLLAEAVREQRYSPGGASNVVANVAALEPASVLAIGVIGNDIFGRELLRQLRKLKIDTSGLIIQKENFDTVTFAKRYLNDQEQPRIDFGFFNRRSRKTDRAILDNLRKALNEYDVVIFNQQVPGSLTNEEFIDECNRLFLEFNDKIILFDSRHYGHRFKHVYRKTNDIEVARLNGVDVSSGDIIPLCDIKKFAQKLFNESHKPVFVTRGARGIITVDDDGIHEIPGIQLLGKIDPVGAGDTTISALGLCLGAGYSPSEAAEFANFAAAVTVQKLFTTGTASAPEIIEMCRNADYIYQPELAEDIRQARYIEGTEIEVCGDMNIITSGKIKHAVFDHDGTISTLRQGWEAIMEPVMIRAILGDQYETADETLYHKVRNRVLEFIEATTGMQTIVQMEGLVALVKEFGIVPESQILDKFGYKEIYNNALMEMVNKRMAKLKRGELDATDFTVKGAVDFLKALRDHGVTLYLASGTDREDVEREAKSLGYADLFNGGIYGAVGDIKKYSKKIVIEKIMNENQLSGVELLVVGDGPVEIRECRKRDGIAIGVASDEIRRHGLNTRKRTRLIKAGAQLVIPDYSQKHHLLTILFPE